MDVFLGERLRGLFGVSGNVVNPRTFMKAVNIQTGIDLEMGYDANSGIVNAIDVSGVDGSFAGNENGVTSLDDGNESTSSVNSVPTPYPL